MRTAYHEAAHAVAWTSAPFSPPDVHLVSIEARGAARGCVTIRARRRDERSGDPLVHRLRVGLALESRSVERVARALATAMAHVRVIAAGAVAESLLTGEDADLIGGAAADYLDADDLARAVGCDPEATWARESRAARTFLARCWAGVARLAEALLRQPRGRGSLSGAALRAVLLACLPKRPRREPGLDYAPLARELLASHRARWCDAHWVVARCRARASPERTVTRHETEAEAIETLQAVRALGRSATFTVRRRGARPTRRPAP